MAYSAAVAVPRLIEQSIAGPRTWAYESADAAAVVDGAGYISDGYQRGMRAGDFVRVYNSAGTIFSTHRVVSANATTGAVNLADGTTVGSATDSD